MRNVSAVFLLLASSSVLAGGYGVTINQVTPGTLSNLISHLKSAPAPAPDPAAKSIVDQPAPTPAQVAETASPAAAPTTAPADRQVARIVTDPKTGVRRLELEVQILFKVADSTLNPEYDAFLAELATVLNTEPTATLAVIGNTDSTADAAYNMGLSVERAKVVAAMLVTKGLPVDRMLVKGAGETNPVADNTTEAGRQANRRTDLVLVVNGQTP